MNRNKVFQLKCYMQHNEWGKIGSDSEVAKLLRNSDPTLDIDEETPYAELWMGTHLNGPSTVIIPGVPEKYLDEWMLEHPEALGVSEKSNGSLPFLFKVLSIGKALSLQAHPDKKLAEKLHASDPKIYRDSNHKPEMVIALTDFSGICGFRPIVEVARYVQGIAELRSVIGAANAARLINASRSEDTRLHKEVTKCCFSALLANKKKVIETHLKTLVDRVKVLDANGQEIDEYVGDVLLKLDDEFPGDVGGFSIYFLNIVRLRKGEAMFVDAGVPHAYLSGDCIESMSCSDNVLRGGLTAKYADIDTLVEMLDYGSKTEDETKLTAVESEQYGCTIRRFSTHINEFAVTEIQVPSGVMETKLPAMPSATIVICIEGSAILGNETLAQPIEVRRGTVLFISANEAVHLQLAAANGMLLFRAHPGN